MCTNDWHGWFHTKNEGWHLVSTSNVILLPTRLGIFPLQAVSYIVSMPFGTEPTAWSGLLELILAVMFISSRPDADADYKIGWAIDEWLSLLLLFLIIETSLVRFNIDWVAQTTFVVLGTQTFNRVLPLNPDAPVVGTNADWYWEITISGGPHHWILSGVLGVNGHCANILDNFWY